MAIKFPDYPKLLDKNDCYRELMIEYNLGIRAWNLKKLLKVYPKSVIDILVEYEIIVVARDGLITLAFQVPGTVSNLICRFLSREIFAFSELLHKLPAASKCDTNRLKNFIIYLTNFNQIQYFHFPGSGLTCVYSESSEQKPEIDLILDYVFSLSDEL